MHHTALIRGQGYQVQIMETYCEEDKGLNLITYVHVEPAHKSDAHALIPALESVKDRDLHPERVLADSLYGSDENCEKAKELSVELVAPVMGKSKDETIQLSDFQISQRGEILSCPKGHAPIINKKEKNRFAASFNTQHCSICPLLLRCPIKVGKKFYYLRYTDKQLRVAKRRDFEGTPEFKDRYRWRSGIEGTFSQYKRLTGVEKLRVRGLRAVRFSAVLKALALNIFSATAVKMAFEDKNSTGPATVSVPLRIILFVKERFSAIRQIFKDVFGFFFNDFVFDVQF